MPIPNDKLVVECASIACYRMRTELCDPEDLNCPKMGILLKT